MPASLSTEAPSNVTFGWTEFLIGPEFDSRHRPFRSFVQNDLALHTNLTTPPEEFSPKILVLLLEGDTNKLALLAMSESTDIAKEEAASAAAVPPPSACRKKKSEVDEGFVKDLINHIDEFVNASYDEHKTCLQKTVKKLFGMNKAVGTSAPSPPPVVSVLPLRVDTSTGKQNV